MIVFVNQFFVTLRFLLFDLEAEISAAMLRCCRVILQSPLEHRQKPVFQRASKR